VTVLLAVVWAVVSLAQAVVDPLVKLEEPAALRRAGEWEKAIAQLQTLAAAETPGPSAETALALGVLQIRNGDSGAAEAPLRQAASLTGPLKLYADLLLSECLHAQGRDADAWQILRGLPASGASPDFSARTARLRARVLHGLHRYAEEAAAWRAIAEGRAGQGPREAAFFRLAQALESSGQLQAAVQAYESILYGRLQSPYVRAAAQAVERLRASGKVRTRALTPAERLPFAEKLLRCGHAEVALSVLDAIPPDSLKGDQGRAASFAKLSCLYFLRDNAGAVAEADALWAAWAEHPTALMAQLKAGWALVRAGDPAGAQERVRRVLEGAGRDVSLIVQAHMLAGMSAYVTGRFAEAAESFAAVESASSDSGMLASALYKKAWCLFALGDHAAAKALFLQVAERFREPGYREPSLYWAGRCALLAGDLAGGAQEFQILSESGSGFWSGRAGELLSSSGGAASPKAREVPFPPRWAPELEVPQTAMARTLDLCGLEGEASYAFEPFYRRHRKEPAAALTFALLCADGGRHAEARATLVRAFGRIEESADTPEPFLRVLRPASHLGLIRKAAREAVVPLPLMLALIRNESSFDEDSFSPAGAVGLMQVVPRTADVVSKEMGVEPPPPEALAEVSTNLKLGSRYLEALLKRFPTAEAVASYNAGEDAVSAWASAFGTAEPERFIGMIPYLETRLYVARVLRDEQLYRRLYP